MGKEEERDLMNSLKTNKKAWTKERYEAMKEKYARIAPEFLPALIQMGKEAGFEHDGTNQPGKGE